MIDHLKTIAALLAIAGLVGLFVWNPAALAVVLGLLFLVSLYVVILGEVRGE